MLLQNTVSTFNTALFCLHPLHFTMQHNTALNETQMSVLRLVGYVSYCTTCDRKSLHEGVFE